MSTALLNAKRQQRQDPNGPDDGRVAEVEWVGVSKVFRSSRAHVEAISDVTLRIRKRERLALTGPSGCGKTTLLGMVAGLVSPTSGSIRQRGRLVDGVNTSVGYVTQKDTVLPWRTVDKNAGLALELRGVGRRDRARRIGEVLDLVGLSGYERLYPSELSGGMLKRLLLARTLVHRPSVLLLDEPFSALDAQLRVSLHAELLRIWEATETTIILVTHDLFEAISLSDRVVVLGGKPSGVVMDCVVDLPAMRDPFAAQLEPEFHALAKKLWSALRSDDGGERDAAT